MAVSAFAVVTATVFTLNMLRSTKVIDRGAASAPNRGRLMLAALRAWLFKPMLDELETRHDEDKKLAFARGVSVGHMEGWDKGRAFGQLEGQQQMMAELTRITGERRQDVCDFTAADIERARKGILH